jgi:hypothetical protein
MKAARIKLETMGLYKTLTSLLCYFKTMKLYLGLMFLTVMGCESSNPSTPSETSSQTNNEVSESSPFPDCEPNTRPEFTDHITDLSLIHVIEPLGCVNCGALGRTYMHPKTELVSDGTKVPIYAPIDMKLVASSYYKLPQAPESYKPEWYLTFEVSCEVNLQLAHIKEVIEVINNSWVGDPSPSSAPQPLENPVQIKAGELIGYWIKLESSIAFDVVIQNKSQTNQFANQSRYTKTGGDLLTNDCPYDYFSAALKAEYYSLFGATSSGPVPDTTCRNTSRDKVGTLAGAWFLSEDDTKGINESESIGTYGSPFIIATEANGNILARGIPPDNNFRLSAENLKDPEAITLQNPMHCYQLYETPTLKKGFLFFKVISESQMEASYNETGDCPAEFPISESQIYYR